MVFTLEAHQTGLSYINIQEDSFHKIDIVYKKPLSDKKSMDIVVRYPQECVKSFNTKKSIENGFIITKYKLWCGSKGLEKNRIWIDGLIAKDRGVLIRYEKGDLLIKYLLRATSPFIHLNHKSTKLELYKSIHNWEFFIY